MSEIIVAEQVGATIWRLLAPVAGSICLVALGLAGGEAWEHTRHPAIFGWTPFGRSLSTKLQDEIATEPGKIQGALRQGLALQSAADRPFFDAWAVRLHQEDTDIKNLRDAAANAVSVQDRFTNSQADAAFRLGQASCRAATNAQTFSSPGSASSNGVQPQPGSDFAELFRTGAFAAGGQTAVPARSNGGDPQ